MQNFYLDREAANNSGVTPVWLFWKKQDASPLNEKSWALLPPGALYDDVTNHSDISALRCSWVTEENGLKGAVAMKYWEIH